MKQKAFTLTELLAVIVIIGILLILIIPSIINRLSDSADEVSDTENQLIYDAADQYIKEHPSEYPPGQSGRYCITIQSLVDDGKLVAPVTDVNTGKDITNLSVMVTVYSTGNTEHELKEGAECEELSALPMIDFKVEPKGSSWVKQRKVTIIYPTIEGDYQASHRIDKGTWIRDSSADKGGNVELIFNKIGQLEAKLTGTQIISSKINIINVDSEKPEIRNVSVPDNWDNKNKTVTVTVYDGISGVQAYYISTENNKPTENSAGWIDVNQDSGEKQITIDNLPQGTYYLWLKDKAGNISDSSTEGNFVVDKIDQVAPTCELILSGTLGNNSWYRSNVKVSINYSDASSGVKDYGITTSSTVNFNSKKEITQTADTASVTYYGHVRDKAGNTYTCSKTFKKDSTKPTLTYTLKLPNGSNYKQGTWSRSTVTRKFTAKDNLSEIAKIQYSSNGSSGWTTENNSGTWKLTEGKKTGYWRSVDNAGNVSKSVHLELLVDKTPPTVPYCYNVHVNRGMKLLSTNCNGKRDCTSSFQATGSVWNVGVDVKSTDKLSGLKDIETYYRPSKYANDPDTSFCNWVPKGECPERWPHSDLPVTFYRKYRARDKAGNVSDEAECNYYFRY